MNYDRASTWPAGSYRASGDPIVGNAWVFVNLGGTWHAATWEWLRPGQTEKSTRAVAGDHIKRGPLKDWTPRSGETYGFMVSTQARLGYRSPINERSNVSMVVWP